MAKKILKLLLISGLLLGWSCPVAQGGESAAARILRQLESPRQSVRQMGREQLADNLNRIHEKRPEQAGEMIRLLVGSLADKKRSIDYRLGICDTLRRLDFFWRAGDPEQHRAAQFQLYRLYQNSTEPGLKKAADQALMQSEGLYAQALSLYREGEVDPAIEAMFCRTFERFPQSRYAPPARYHRGLYLMQAGLKQKDAQTLKAALGAFDRFLETDGDKGPLRGEAKYARALSLILLDRRTQAVSTLEKLEKQAGQTVYIYRFLPLDPSGAPVVDRYFELGGLAKQTRRYLENHADQSFDPARNPGAIRDLDGYLRGAE